MEFPICYNKNLKLVKWRSCCHKFCVECYRNWSQCKNTCPLCRQIKKFNPIDYLFQLKYNFIYMPNCIIIP